ncbi:helix-turn-helix domain-containing protein [Acinetobacter baumannii]|uniref:helix-turn-helix domain-containing protein n=1 Tax=Acinetobacter baumannii TaxID=470 RepID=UPI003A895584
MSGSVGSRIRSIRGKESRASFAEKLGIGTTTLQRYENDERSPDIEFLSKLHIATGYSFDYLVYGKETELPAEENLVLSKFREATPDIKNKILMLLLSGNDATKDVVKNKDNTVQGQQVGDNNQQDNYFGSVQKASVKVKKPKNGTIVGIKNN